MPKLRAPKGTDQANFGKEAFPVDTDGTVDVPLEAVESLTKVGGFEILEPEAPVAESVPAADDRVAVSHPEGSGASWGGQSYEADEAGVVLVPLAAVADLLDHGFSVVKADVPPEPEPPEEPAPAQEPAPAPSGEPAPEVAPEGGDGKEAAKE